MVGQIIRHRTAVDFRLDCGRFEQSLDLRAKVKRAIIGVSVVKRLYSQAIASDKQLLAPLIPDGKSKHAAQVVNTTLTVLFVEMQDCFRIAVCLVNVTQSLKLFAKISVVVDLTVVCDMKS